MLGAGLLFGKTFNDPQLCELSGLCTMWVGLLSRLGWSLLSSEEGEQEPGWYWFDVFDSLSSLDSLRFDSRKSCSSFCSVITCWSWRGNTFGQLFFGQKMPNIIFSTKVGTL